MIACQLAGRGLGWCLADPFVARSSGMTNLVLRPLRPAFTLQYGFLYPVWQPRSRIVSDLSEAIAKIATAQSDLLAEILMAGSLRTCEIGAGVRDSIKGTVLGRQQAAKSHSGCDSGRRGEGKPLIRERLSPLFGEIWEAAALSKRGIRLTEGRFHLAAHTYGMGGRVVIDVHPFQALAFLDVALEFDLVGQTERQVALLQ